MTTEMHVFRIPDLLIALTLTACGHLEDDTVDIQEDGIDIKVAGTVKSATDDTPIRGAELYTVLGGSFRWYGRETTWGTGDDTPVNVRWTDSEGQYTWDYIGFKCSNEGPHLIVEAAGYYGDSSNTICSDEPQTINFVLSPE